MPIVDLFSKRQRRARGEVPDVYVYDQLPQQLRVQIVHIIQDAIGFDQYNLTDVKTLYDWTKNVLCREYGVFRLRNTVHRDDFEVLQFFIEEHSVERALDVVEICFKLIDSHVRENWPYRHCGKTTKIKPDEAISELNERFKEHGIGYRFEANMLIRVDSQFVHAEAVKPTLLILNQPEFEGANQEFLNAHEHYRHGRYKECIVESLKAFESVLKSICKTRDWEFETNSTVKKLIDICFKNGLIPQYLETQFSSLRSLLESGTPTIRNKSAAHGQGPEPAEAPEHLARYALNLTATNILFLAEAHNALPQP